MPRSDNEGLLPPFLPCSLLMPNYGSRPRLPQETMRFLGLGRDSGPCFWKSASNFLALEDFCMKRLKECFKALVYQASLVLSLYLSSFQVRRLQYVITYIIGITSTLGPYPSAPSRVAYTTQNNPTDPVLVSRQDMERRRGALIR